MNIGLKIDGIDELQKKLARLGRQAATKAQKNALREPAKMVQSAFVSASPTGDTGRLKRAQKTKWKTYRNSGSTIAVVGADYKVAPHVHLVEWGTADRYRKKMAQFPKRGFTGRMKPARVFQRAFESIRSAVQR
jgi:HK97 gp10 family phage protein